jgi:hypothetical protein
MMGILGLQLQYLPADLETLAIGALIEGLTRDLVEAGRRSGENFGRHICICIAPTTRSRR